MKGFVRQVMAINSTSPALLCTAQAVMLYQFLCFYQSYVAVYRPGRKYALVSKYALKSLMHLKTCVYGTSYEVGKGIVW